MKTIEEQIEHEERATSFYSDYSELFGEIVNLNIQDAQIRRRNLINKLKQGN